MIYKIFIFNFVSLKNLIMSILSQETQNTLSELGIQGGKVNWNLSPKTLAKIAVEKEHAIKTDTGAINISTGEFTGRSPLDRFIVKDNITKNKIWWGDVNIPFKEEDFNLLYDKITKYLSNKEIYARNCYACADEKHRVNIRVVNEYAYSNLFSNNMFLRPSKSELKNFKAEWTILNAPRFFANPKVDGTRQHNFAILSFTKKMIIIGGTAYTGEIKKSIFSALNFILPTKKNVLPMHCSANIGQKADTAIFFGLSGTGKTTLSADPSRNLIGDDEHGWDGNTVFNFEGGCYAKCLDLSAEKEPDIHAAVKEGALLENISFFPETNKPNYADGSITQNTRVSYPIEHIENIAIPSLGKNPKNIFFLTADAFGVLPPVSKLSAGQAMYHFISGYTAKVAGTEAGITEPQTTFSACFGAPFMPLHPTKYAEMLGEKIREENVNVWLINTGWSGGEYSVGKRIPLKYTRAMITAILNQTISKNYITDKIFKLNIPSSCPNVPSEILTPRSTWDNKDYYDKKAIELASAFNENFKQFAGFANQEILNGAPISQ